jgi:hypothetical protein
VNGYYWVIVRYPAGAAQPTGPITALNTVGLTALTSQNKVIISWNSQSGATGYDVIRSVNNVYPGTCTSCAVAVNTTLTTVTDTNSGLLAYPPSNLAAAGAASVTFNINNISESQPFINANFWGNFRLALLSGLYTIGNCVKLAAGGNLADAGTACNAGSFPSDSGLGGSFLSSDGSGNRSWAYVLTTGAFGSQLSPATGNTGQMFIPSGGTYLYRSNGVTNDVWGGQMWNITPPPALGTFTAVNSAVGATNSDGTISLNVPKNGSTSARLLYTTSGFSAPYTFTVLMQTNWMKTSTSACGIGLYDTVSTKFVTHALSNSDTNPQIELAQYTNPTTFSADYFTAHITDRPYLWFQIKDDGTTRFYSVSEDGFNYIALFNTGNTNFVTPNSFIIFGDTVDNTFNHSCTVKSWVVSHP